MIQQPGLPLGEQYPPVEAPGRFTKLVAATAAALALSGCTDGPKAAKAPAPAETRPAVTADASYNQEYPAQELLSTDNFSYRLDAEIKVQSQFYPSTAPSSTEGSSGATADPNNKLLPGWQTLDNTWPDGTKDYSFPSATSAPVVEVNMAADGTMRYEDQTKGSISSTDVSFLLGAVTYNKELLQASMVSGTVDRIRFRVFEPNQYPDSPDLEPGDYPMFLPRDYTDKANSNLYYFLPAHETLDQQGVATMMRHEAIHGALRHGLDKFTPEDTAVLAEACTTIRDAALQEATVYAYDMVDRLTYLRDHSDTKYASSFNTVIRAIQNNTYQELPLQKDMDEIIQCYIPNPLQAVTQVIKHQGVDTEEFSESLWSSNEKSEATVGVVDDWNEYIENDTIYAALREATYLRTNETPDKRGHPQQGAHEIMTSFLNVALSFPEEAARKLNGTDPKQIAGIDTIVRKSIGQIKQKQNNAELNTWLDVRYGIFKSELNKIA